MRWDLRLLRFAGLRASIVQPTRAMTPSRALRASLALAAAALVLWITYVILGTWQLRS